MKQKSIALLSLCIVFFLGAQASKIIKNPYYKVSKSGVFHVAQIETNRKETRLTIHATIVPDGWVKFSDAASIEITETGKKIYPKAIEGGEFNKEIRLHTGDSTFVLIYPRLSKKVKSITYDDTVYDISLDENHPNHPEINNTNPEAEQWIKEQLDKAAIKTPADLDDSTQFFNSTSARLIGYIKGYDSRLGMLSGSLDIINPFTGDYFSTPLDIMSDGRFEASLSLLNPICTSVNINDQKIDFYIEPGQTLAMVIDWNEFLIADRLKEPSYKLKELVFEGPLAAVNQELLKITVDVSKPKVDSCNTLSPLDFRDKVTAVYNQYEKRLRDYCKDNDFGPKAKSLIEVNKQIDFANVMFGFEQSMLHLPKRANLPLDFYDFLQTISLNNYKLLSGTDFKQFIQNFEYCDVFSKADHMTFNLYYFYKYLKMNGVCLAAEDEQIWSKADNINTLIHNGWTFVQKYIQYYPDFQKQYDTTGKDEKYINLWKGRDSLMINDLKLEPNLMQQIVKFRSSKFYFSDMNKDEATRFLNFIQTGVYLPILKDEMQQVFYENFDSVEDSLSKEDIEDFFKALISPLRTRYLVVDFWKETYDYCLSNIELEKPLIEKYADNRDVAFLFLSPQNDYSLKEYTKYVMGDHLTVYVQIPAEKYNQIQDFYHINGSAHQMLIGKDGEILEPNLGAVINEAFVNNLIKKMADEKEQDSI
ncbi:MAG: hypothetical protein PHH37_12615 [Paludibacter sp.]|nr:hypothetical protein [Paludibacter sp.]